MKKNSPKLRIATDDDMSATSCLQVSVCEELDDIKLEHMNQSGRVETICIYTGQVDKLVKFLQQSKAWIESGYEPELKPESYTESSAEWFNDMWKE
jgi:hypothetical protein